MILDDSRYFKEDLPILKMIKFLENTNYDLIGGRILNRDKYSCLFNSINKKKKEIKIKCKENEKINNNLFKKIYKTNIVTNTFIAKVKSLKNSPWRDELKLSEHTVFFYDFYKKGYKCAFSPEIEFHNVNKKNYKYEKDYQKFRERPFNIKVPISIVNIDDFLDNNKD